MSQSAPPGGWPLPRSVYLHVPFCRHRCGYCNFSVVADRDDLMERFLAAVDKETSVLGKPAVDTVFLGGGTPTHLPGHLLERLLKLIDLRFELSDCLEFSVEANPEDIDTEKLAILADHGVNRISLGVQSFNDAKLAVLERGHNEASARQAIESSAAQIGNVSIDLIFAAPGESPDDWQTDLNIATSLPIDHLSTYALTFEKGTQFWNRQRVGYLHPAPEDDEVEMYLASRHTAEAAGFQHYEISNFAKPNKRCRHNLVYWRGQGWLAAGPGAARFVDGRREVNHRSTTTYLKRMATGQSPVGETEILDTIEYARERVAFGVRMIDGINLAEIHEDTGVDVQSLCEPEMRQMVREGWVELNENHLRLTDSGILFADLVASNCLG